MGEVLKNFINGHWEGGATTGTSENPSDLSAPVAEYARADARQAEAAVAAAQEAFASWSFSSPQRRADALDAAGGELLARRDELGRLLAREAGRTLPEAVAEVARAGQVFRFFAGEALRLAHGPQATPRADADVEVTREPLGVVAVIAPFSGPFALPAAKIAPALACGNTVVFKPAERVAACGWALADVIGRAGLPAGVFNLVNGSGRQLGRVLAEHRHVAALSFAGAQATAQRVRQQAAARGARIQVETGGSNALVVLADADLDRAVECAVQGAFHAAGQRCTASSRLVVATEVHDLFVHKLRQRMRFLKVGPADDRGVDLGPVASAGQLDADLSFLAIARAEGAEPVCGGELLERRTRGHFLAPALLLARPEQRALREPVFGPIALVLRAGDYEQALAIANDTTAARSAALCTRSLRHALHFRRHAQARAVLVNLPTTAADAHVPQPQDRDAAGFFTRLKTAYLCA